MNGAIGIHCSENDLRKLLCEFLFRLIFGATLETFPGAFLNLTAGLMMASGYAYFYLFTQRRTIMIALKEQDSGI